MFTWPTAAIHASRSTTSEGKYLRQIKINVPFDYNEYGPEPSAPSRFSVTYLRSEQWGPASPWTVCITPGPESGAVRLGCVPRPRLQDLAWTGKFWAGSAGPAEQLKQFGWIHEIECPSENEIYVGELLNWRVQKLMLHPAK